MKYDFNFELDASYCKKNMLHDFEILKLVLNYHTTKYHDTTERKALNPVISRTSLLRSHNTPFFLSCAIHDTYMRLKKRIKLCFVLCSFLIECHKLKNNLLSFAPKQKKQKNYKNNEENNHTHTFIK